MRRLMRPLALLLAVAAGGAVASAGAQNLRIVERTRDARSDSLAERIFKAKVDEVKLLVSEWRDREEQLFVKLQGAEKANDVMGLRRTEEEIARHSHEAFAMMSALQRRCEMERLPRPEGYVGVSLDTKVEVIGGRPHYGEVTVSSVEPGSPSERAGVLRDDRVIAIGGRDASKGIPNIADLLVPGRVIVMRVDRGGTEREIAVTVEPRPKELAESCGDFERALMPLRRIAFSGMMRREPGTSGGGERVRVSVSGTESRRAPPEEMRVVVFDASPAERRANAYFAGAQFRTLDADWREVLGVKQGVIVNEVATGSVAARAGLRGGDVVTFVGETAVTDPLSLIQALNINERGEATLVILRAKEKKEILLRWGMP